MQDEKIFVIMKSKKYGESDIFFKFPRGGLLPCICNKKCVYVSVQQLNNNITQNEHMFKNLKSLKKNYLGRTLFAG